MIDTVLGSHESHEPDQKWHPVLEGEVWRAELETIWIRSVPNDEDTSAGLR